MPHSANLELKLKDEEQHISSRMHGIRVYGILERLAGFLDKNKNPTDKQLQDWFLESGSGLLPFHTHHTKQHPADYSVQIDVPNGQITMDGDWAYLGMKHSDYKTEYADLKERLATYGYEIKSNIGDSSTPKSDNTHKFFFY